MKYRKKHGLKSPINVVDAAFNVAIVILVIIFFMVAAKPVLASEAREEACLVIEQEAH